MVRSVCKADGHSEMATIRTGKKLTVQRAREGAANKILPILRSRPCGTGHERVTSQLAPQRPLQLQAVAYQL